MELLHRTVYRKCISIDQPGVLIEGDGNVIIATKPFSLVGNLNRVHSSADVSVDGYGNTIGSFGTVFLNSGENNTVYALRIYARPEGNNRFAHRNEKVMCHIPESTVIIDPRSIDRLLEDGMVLVQRTPATTGPFVWSSPTSVVIRRTPSERPLRTTPVSTPTPSLPPPTPTPPPPPPPLLPSKQLVFNDYSRTALPVKRIPPAHPKASTEAEAIRLRFIERFKYDPSNRNASRSHVNVVRLAGELGRMFEGTYASEHVLRRFLDGKTYHSRHLSLFKAVVELDDETFQKLWERSSTHQPKQQRPEEPIRPAKRRKNNDGTYVIDMTEEKE
jgi:hypothetical protein